MNDSRPVGAMNQAEPPAVGSPLERGVRPHVEAHPPLPTPAAWNCYWKGDNDGPSWDQWHDASDPMPERWEGDPPDEVVPHFTAAQVLEYAGQCVRDATAECSQHWQRRVQQLEAAEEGAAHAFGVVVQEKRDLEAECRRLRELLDSAYAQIRRMARDAGCGA